ncbi:hypothetical protein BDQ12DRAFT_689652 [Crucibulum laeve]|uniref:Uncharacterized protein n=1 Tax=Crucibulum laeve TaxID=68775 RepID=A0A5C3LPE0_9AGAR|nr:hypothetical protein BDQ12DRAFT_689652 [Crucibulum laeve]
MESTTIISGGLYPTTPGQTTRYDSPTNKSKLSDAVIEPAHFLSTRETSPVYLPPQWSEYIHPEGEIYFARASVPSVVTTADLYNPEVATSVTRWINHILELLAEKSIIVHENVELFIRIDADQDCLYYFVDNTSHTVFWIERYDTSQLNLGTVASTSHLRTLLEAEYWDHVQTFPMHTSGLPLENIDELVNVLTHAAADHLTSSSGTFGFGAEKCMKFVKILKATRDNHRNGYTTCVAARLWNVIQRTRQWNHYGQKQARLATIQSILDLDAVDVPCWSGLLTSAASLKTAETYLSSLDAVFLDHVIFEERWHDFMKVCFADWRSNLYNVACTLILNIFMIFTLPSVTHLMMASAAFLSASLLASTLLIQRHEHLETGDTGSAHDFMSAVRSQKFGFQWVALVYSLPKAFFLWSLVAMFIQWLVVINYYTSSGFTMGLTGVVILALFASRQILSESSAISTISRFFSRRRSHQHESFQEMEYADEKDSILSMV